jgi:hypothetical protein
MGLKYRMVDIAGIFFNVRAHQCYHRDYIYYRLIHITHATPEKAT